MRECAKSLLERIAKGGPFPEVGVKSPCRSLTFPGVAWSPSHNYSPIAANAQNRNIPKEQSGAYHLSGVRRQQPTSPRTGVSAESYVSANLVSPTILAACVARRR